MEELPTQLVTSVSADSVNALNDISIELDGCDRNLLYIVAQSVCSYSEYHIGHADLVTSIVDEFRHIFHEDYCTLYGLTDSVLMNSDIGAIVQESINSATKTVAAVAMEIYSNLLNVSAPYLESTGECVYEVLECSGRNVVFVIKIPPLMFLGSKKDIDVLSLLRGRELY